MFEGISIVCALIVGFASASVFVDMIENSFSLVRCVFLDLKIAVIIIGRFIEFFPLDKRFPHDTFSSHIF